MRAPTAGRPGPAFHRPATLLLPLTLCGLLLVSCTIGPSRRGPLATVGSGGAPPPTTAPSSMPIGPGGPGRSADPIRWGSCPSSVAAPDPAAGAMTLDCGGIPVPVSYSDLSQGTMAIRLARARAAGLPPDAPALLVLPDEPGENGRDSIAAIAGSLPQEIQKHFAIIVVDQRGTGSSSPVDCVADNSVATMLGLAADPTSTAGAAQLENLSRQLTFDCGDVVGPRLTQFNSTNSADDLDTLRAALGIATIAILGRGYGAMLGAVYANRYPGRVGALVLDSPTDPLAALDQRAAGSAVAAEKALDDFSAACPGFTGGCPLGADPRATITALVTRLAESGDTTADGHVMTGGSILLALMLTLGTSRRWPDLARAIHSMADDQPDALNELLVAAVGGAAAPERLSASVVYRCNDSAQRLRPAQIADSAGKSHDTAPLFGAFALSRAAMCASWPAPDAALGAVKAAGAPPILVIGTVGSIAHTYTQAQSVAGQLASAVLISWQSAESDGYPASTCIRSAVDAYLLRGELPAIGTLCPP